MEYQIEGTPLPVVVMPVVSGPPMLMARNLLYTAVTRAKDVVVALGDRECIRTMVNNDRKALRYTHLRGMLTDG